MTHERFDEIISVMLARWGESAIDSAPPNNIRNICERMLCSVLYELELDIDRYLQSDEEDERSRRDVILGINSPEP